MGFKIDYSNIKDRECRICKEVKDINDYEKYFVTDKITGIKYNHHRHQCKTCRSYYHASLNYGLTIEEVKAIKSKTNCEICNKYISNTRDRYIDHNHETGKVRGMLCPRCNGVLELFEYQKDIINNFNKYLKKYNDK